MSSIEWLGENCWWLTPLTTLLTAVIVVTPAYYYIGRAVENHYYTTKILQDRIHRLEMDRLHLPSRRDVERS